MENEKNEQILPQAPEQAQPDVEVAEETLMDPQPEEAVPEEAVPEAEEIPSILPQGDDWLDQLFGSTGPIPEIEADEQAMSSVGLTHPDDLELENILAENWDAPQAEAPAAQEPAPAEPAPQEEEDTTEADILAFLATFDFGEDKAAQPEEVTPEDLEKTQKFTAAEEPAVPAEPASPDPKKPRRPKPAEQKTRPRRPRGYGLFGIPHLMATAIWLVIIAIIGTTVGNLLWVAISDMLAFGKPDQSVTLTITASDTVDSVASKLGDAGLIRYPELFKLFANLTGKGERIEPGTYTLNAMLDYNALINGMVQYAKPKDTIDVMIPEGYNCAQIFRLLENKGVCTAAELEAYATDGELSEYWFLDGVKRGSKYCLEGYLFPDTYTFYVGDTPRRVLEKFLDAFDARFTDRMKERFEMLQESFAQRLKNYGYSNSYIQENQLTLHDVVTLASIVQGETSSDLESYDIAAVFLNRLAHPDFPYLGSDATVYYAIGDYFREKGELTQSDLDVDSPYNTRNNKGLPPGAICNPGTDSLYAVLDPNDSGYYYFVYDAKAGCHRFSKTYSEHLAWIKKLGL